MHNNSVMIDYGHDSQHAMIICYIIIVVTSFKFLYCVYYMLQQTKSVSSNATPYYVIYEWD